MTAIEAIPLTVKPDNVPAHLVVDFDVHAPTNARAGFHAAWKAFQDSAPADIVWTPRNGGHWIITRGTGVKAAFADYEHFSSKVIFVPKETGQLHHLPPGAIDPPEHQRFRSVLNEGMALRNMPAAETMVRELAVSLIESFRDKGHCNFVKDFAEILPIHLFMRMVNVPLKDAHKLKHWTDQITKPEIAVMSTEEATQCFRDYLMPYLENCMAHPGDDMMSRMIAAQPADRPLNKIEMLDLSVQILSAGLDTVVNFLGFAFMHLATNPDQRRMLIEKPAMAPRAIEEMFRRYPLVTIGRLVREDYTFLGAELKSGDMIVIPSALHGLDERENPEPLKVDFERTKATHSTFGNGHHRCPGAPLARIELRIVLQEWLSRIPDFHITPGAEIICQGGVVGSIVGLPLSWPTA